MDASAPRERCLAFTVRRGPKRWARLPYDIAPDGKRFLVRVEVQNDPGLTLVTNWPALLKKGLAVQ